MPATTPPGAGTFPSCASAGGCWCRASPGSDGPRHRGRGPQTTSAVGSATAPPARRVQPMKSIPPDGAQDNAAADPQWEDPHPWPVLHKAALYGIAGDVVHTLDPHTEAD